MRIRAWGFAPSRWRIFACAVKEGAGRFLPNAFGLFDVHGNVSEWCRDPDSPYGSERPGDGLRITAGSLGQRYHRGGNWANVALKARSAYRGTRADGPESTVGVRAVRTWKS